jgi:hypothetical protein
MIPKTPSKMENVRRLNITSPKPNRCSALWSMHSKQQSNDKKRKANENYAFDDNDVFDQFNIDDMHDIINQDDEIIRILMNRKQAITSCIMNQIL